MAWKRPEREEKFPALNPAPVVGRSCRRQRRAGRHNQVIDIFELVCERREQLAVKRIAVA